MNDEEFWFWLCNCEGVYSESIGRLIAAYGNPENIYRSDYKKLAADAVINKKLLWNLMQEKKSGNFLKRLDKMKNKGMDFIYFVSEAFPERLKAIPDHPWCLYVKGKLPDPAAPSCAIVGARACSEYGKKQTVEFSSILAGYGIQIISGMAAGIDSIAQKAAIDAGGATFAVLGSGADVIYPVENMGLYYEIISSGGGIISEYPPGTAPLAWQFPHRNRIISGLSDKLLIMEARKRSGTLTTARHALDQGRDICVLPGRITDPLSEGCNELIYDGAGICLSPRYILNDLLWNKESRSQESSAFYEKSSHADAKEKKGAPVCAPNNTAPAASRENILKYLSSTPRCTDEIAGKANVSIEEAAINLAALELEGLVKEVSKDFYVTV